MVRLVRRVSQASQGIVARKAILVWTGLHGKDGIGLAGGFINRDGVLILTMTDGTVRELNCVVGKDGAPGERGARMAATASTARTGLASRASRFEPEFDGERTARLRWIDAAGKEQVREWRFPIVIDRGVYKPGAYRARRRGVVRRLDLDRAAGYDGQAWQRLRCLASGGQAWP